MASNMKNPPILDDSASYDSWSKLVKIWQKFTDLPREKQGPAVLLSLKGKPLEYVLELSIDDISSAGGFNTVLTKLDTLYKKDAVETAYEAYERFEKFQRPNHMNITDYVNEFEKLLNKTKSHGSVISSDILAYRLLTSANISEDHARLARATSTDLKYDSMKLTLKKFFSSIGNCPSSDHAAVKVEDVNEVVSEEFEDVLYGRNSYRRPTRFIPRGRNLSRGSVSYRPNFDIRKKKGRNPLDAKGNCTRCTICDSINHYAAVCPDSTYFVEEHVEGVDKEYDIVLFQSNLLTQHHFEIFVAESSTSAILDSGASATVTGRLWLESYLDGLSSEMSRKVQYSTSNNYFKFGSDQKYKSLFQVMIPAQIGAHNVMIKTDVVDSSIPLLLSKAAMKTAKTKINFTDDTVNMFGEKQPVKLTSSGHYAVPLNSNDVILREVEQSENVNVTLHTEDLDYKHVARKLHSQFSHPSKKRLFKLVERAGLGNNQELLEEIKVISDSCQICKEFKKPTPKPSVGLPLASSFNEVVAMDLKFFHGNIILHLIDHVTRFSMAILVDSKKPEDIIAGIFKSWITVFGPPQKFLTDNGGEFNNAKFLELCEAMNIIVLTTAAESPWSNGLVERHNAILAEMLHRTKAEVDCNLDVALSWVIHAKNSLANVHGFTPYQLTIGATPNLPGILVDKPPALDEPNYQDMLSNNLAAMKSARKAFMEAESSERIKRALVHNIRPSSNNKFYIGDTVYYKRMDSRKWKGPGRVIGHDIQQILVKHGGNFVRVHPCRVMLDKRVSESSEEIPIEKGNIVKPTSAADCMQKFSVHNDFAAFSDSEDSDSDHERATQQQTKEQATTQQNLHEQDLSVEKSISVDKTIKKGMLINMRPNGGGDWIIGQVLNRTGKATGKYKYFWNIRDIATDQISEYDMQDDMIDWSVYTDDKLNSSLNKTELKEHDHLVDPSDSAIMEVNIHEQLVAELATDYANAKVEELNRWKEESVYDEVKDEGQFKISTRWVITSKYIDNKIITKARLVARGYEEDGSNIRSDSPTCMRENIRIALSVVASKGWTLNSIDIKSAFLQGKRVSRVIFVNPPKEVKKKGIIWRLNKVVYGLVDASRNWYLKVKEELTTLGAVASKYDKAVFLWKRNHCLEGFVVLHVDDFLWAGNDMFFSEVIVPFRKIFKISKEESQCFSYIGIQLHQRSNNHIAINQKQYSESILPIPLNKEQLQNKDRLATDVEKRNFRSVVGQLGWITGMSRPDVSFSYCELSTCQSRPKILDLIKANKTIRDLKSRDVSIKFGPLNLDSIKMAVFSDASYGNLQGGGSQIGFLVFAYDDENSCVPLLWSSRRAKRVVRSTLSAETLAAVDALDAAFLVKGMFEEFLGFSLPTVHLFVDNKSLYDAVKTTNRLMDKRLLIDMASLRELVENNEVSVTWIPTDYQLADCLTKMGASSKKLLDTIISSHINLTC